MCRDRFFLRSRAGSRIAIGGAPGNVARLPIHAQSVYAAGRVEIAWTVADRHTVRAVSAPLNFDGSGIPDRPLLFAGGSFAAEVAAAASYQFTSCRVPYRDRFFRGDEARLGNRWTFLLDLDASAAPHNARRRHRGPVLIAHAALNP